MWIGVGFVLVAFGGVLPSYWTPVVAGTFKSPTVIYVYGALMFSPLRARFGRFIGV